jgi:phosphoheptose isomerase
MPICLPPVDEPLSTLPITPPISDEGGYDSSSVLETAVHVISTEASALSCLSQLYETDPIARDGFARAVEAIAQSMSQGGKLVVIGVGKSGKIGEKIVASMNSLGILCVFLHPVEALHGDLGVLRSVSSSEILVQRQSQG